MMPSNKPSRKKNDPKFEMKSSKASSGSKKPMSLPKVNKDVPRGRLK